MAGSLGSLVIELAANTARLQSDMGRAVEIANRTAERFKGAFAFLSVGLGVAGSGGMFGEMIRKSVEFGDQLNKLSTKSGMATEAFSQLAYASRLAGVDTASLSTALAKMQVALSNARSGGQEQKQALAALGLTLKDFVSLAPDRQFELLADRINKLKDPADRARAAIAFFGRAGADLLPLFEDGAEGIRKAREEAEKIGQSFSKDKLQALTDAKDSVDRLSESFSAMATTLTAKLAPALKAAFDRITEVINGGEIVRLKKEIADLEAAQNSVGFGEFSTGLAPPDFSKEIAARRARIAELTKSAVSAAAGAAGGGGSGNPPGFKDTEGAIDALLVHLKSTKSLARPMDELRKSWQESTRTAAEAAGAEFGTFTARLNEQLKQNEIDVDEYNKRIEEAIDAQLPKMTTAADKLAGRYKDAVDAMSVYSEQAARNMQSAFADFLFDPFQNGIKGMLKGFVDIIRRMAAEMIASKVFDFLGAWGKSKGGVLGSFLGFFGGGKASGGPVSAGGTYLVGEHGPELLRMGSSSGSIIPNGAGGLVFAPSTHVVLQGGASEEDRAAFAAMLAQNNRVLSEQWRDQLRANGYRLR